ncbi:MAG: hypothetical protein ACRCX2_35900 [Paraclostridium sp.]
MSNIKLTKKNNDGSYDYGEMLFESLDLYGGDHVRRTLEIAPGIAEQSAKYVKFSISSRKDGGSYKFIPERDGSYFLISNQHKGLKFYLESKTGVKYTPDKYGVISITNLLVTPIDVVINLVAEQYAITDMSKEIVIDDIDIEIWAA